MLDIDIAQQLPTAVDIQRVSAESERIVIAGLDSGPHVLRVEPLDDADLDSFFDDPDRVDVDFAVTFSDRLVIVPRGGSSAPVTITVRGK